MNQGGRNGDGEGGPGEQVGLSQDVWWLNCVSLKRYEVLTLVPVNVTLLGNRIVADVIS